MDHWMFNCRKVTQLISESMDRKLPIHHRMGLRVHLFMCKLCSRYKKQLQILRETVRLYAMRDETPTPSTSLPAAARERIKKALSRQLTETE